MALENQQEYPQRDEEESLRQVTFQIEIQCDDITFARNCLNGNMESERHGWILVSVFVLESSPSRWIHCLTSNEIGRRGIDGMKEGRMKREVNGNV